MKYGRTVKGGRWHALTEDGRTFCAAYPSTDRVVSSMTITEVSDGPDVPRDNICLNCHEAFGRKGRRLRRAHEEQTKAATKKRRDVYVPRNRFKE